MLPPAEAAQLPVARLRAFKNDPRRVHVMLRKPGSEPGSIQRDFLAVYEDYPRVVFTNLTVFKEVVDIPGVISRSILNSFDYDALKELVEFNLRYCDGDKSGWPPLLGSGDLDIPKTLKLLEAAALAGTYTLNEATIVDGPPLVEQCSNTPGAVRVTGLNLEERMDLFRKGKILLEGLDVAKMSETEIENCLRRLNTLRVGFTDHRMKSLAQLSTGVDNFKKTRAAMKKAQATNKKAQAANGIERGNKTRDKTEDDSDLASEANTEKQVINGDKADDEDGPNGMASSLQGVRISWVPNQAVSNQDDKVANSAADTAAEAAAASAYSSSLT